MYHTDTYLCQALRYFQISRCTKRNRWVLAAQSCTLNFTHTPSSRLFSIKMSFVSECQACCLDLAELSHAVETWLFCRRGISSTGVPGRWQGQRLIGPKWEWRETLIAIDPLLPPAGSSIFDYDHFTPQSSVCERCWGKSHWEVLVPFAKAVIMRGCEDPRSTRSRCHQAAW